jgi:putative membrane protein insertion efficiency factor
MTVQTWGGPAKILVTALRGLVRLYQIVVRPFYLQPRCRFYPSCSDYALEALTVHGPLRGSWLAVRRLGRCHPFNPGGVDHVPPPAPASRRRERCQVAS